MAILAAELFPEPAPPSSSILSLIQMGYSEDLWFSKPANLAELTLDKQGLYRLGKRKPSARIVIPDVPSVKVALLKEAHNSSAAGHSGPKRTMDLMSEYFWWKGMSDYVFAYVTSCQSCQQMKNANTAPGGKLVPLAIPTSPWESVSMDFITCLPVTANGHDMLIVWVDRLTKYVILAPHQLGTSCTHTELSRLCLVHN